MSEGRYGPAWRVWEQAYAMAARKVDKQRICDLYRANQDLVKDCFSRIYYDIVREERERGEAPYKEPNVEYLYDVYVRYNWLY